MTQHNWHIAKDAQGPMGIFDADGKAIAMFTGTFTPSNGYAWDFPYDERTRIVRVMFVAPDLLAALRRMLAGLECMGDVEVSIAFAEAVIHAKSVVAKAEEGS